MCGWDGTSGGGGAVSDWRKFDGEKFGRKRDDGELVPFEFGVDAAAEKYADKSIDGQNCEENAWRRKSASNADNADAEGVTRSDYKVIKKGKLSSRSLTE